MRCVVGAHFLEGKVPLLLCTKHILSWNISGELERKISTVSIANFYVSMRQSTHTTGEKHLLSLLIYLVFQMWVSNDLKWDLEHSSNLRRESTDDYSTLEEERRNHLKMLHCSSWGWKHKPVLLAH